MTTEIKHVAIIMDGNGRWAKERKRPRFWGHVRGSSVVSDIVKSAEKNGIKALTLYAFSTENWGRPKREISLLFSLLKKYLIKERETILANRLKFRVVGRISHLPQETQKLILNLQETTKNFEGMRLNFAFDYGGRSEILEAVHAFHKEHGKLPETEDDLGAYTYLSDCGDVDLLIRTSGEQRLSNFLLWQMAYAEFYFTQTKWPDFTPKEFCCILRDVSGRERRFGDISSSDFDLVKEKARERRQEILFQEDIH